MNRTDCLTNKVAWLLCALLGGLFTWALTGCYVVEQPVYRGTYEAPPAVGVSYVEIRTENDFYEPLSPYGRWEVVGSYGRCWIPGGVDTHWRPYSNGYWRRTDDGWYWVSDEPWGWATYHYGRWDHSPRHGWYWVPHTQWAPAWVSWRQGNGYVGWAPLSPSARFGRRGFVEADDAIIAPRYVFVEQRRFLEPVHPQTVVVNNTVINKTVNITKTHIVNKTVINEGPVTTVIEEASGRKVQAAPVRELRNKEEAAVVVKHRTPQATSEGEVQAQVPNPVEPRAPKAVPAHEPVAPAPKKEVREAAEPKRATKSARDEEKRAQESEQKAQRESERHGKKGQVATGQGGTNTVNKVQEKKGEAHPAP
jgi:hypothetical protein